MPFHFQIGKTFETERYGRCNKVVFQVELLSQGVRTDGENSAEALRKELQNREMLIAQLITQSEYIL